MIQGDQFILVSVSQNSVLTILKLTEASKDSFLKDGAKFLGKPICNLCNQNVT